MDLNLVRVFVAIAETRSLTTAAARLYVTQPAVSQALGRLRRELDDPLFRRVGREMVPTPLAVSVYPGFRDALAAVERTLDGVRRFDPADSDRLFRIALSELGEIGWLPAIVATVRRRAPRMRIEVVPIEVEALPDWLGRGTVDLAITPAAVPGPFERVPLKTQGYGVVLSSAHPLARGELDLAAYAGAAHAVVSGDSGAPAVDAALARVGVRIEPRIALTQFAALPTLLASGRDLIATAPTRSRRAGRGSGPSSCAPCRSRCPPCACTSTAARRRSTPPRSTGSTTRSRMPCAAPRDASTSSTAMPTR